MSMQCRFDRLTISVNTAATLFWEPNVSLLAIVASMCKLQESRLEESYLAYPGRFGQCCQPLEKIFFSLKHIPNNTKTYKFANWATTNAHSTTFEVDSVKMTVFDYFLKRYGIRLRYPQLPLAHTRDGDFPLEVCFTGNNERYKGKMTPDLTTAMLSFASLPPAIRGRQIDEFWTLLAFHKDQNLIASGLSVCPQQMVVPGRLIDPPTLLYGGIGMKRPAQGRWDLRNIVSLY